MAKFWYRVDCVDKNGSRSLVGSSELDPAQLMKHLSSGEYFALTDLSYHDQKDKIKSWSEWDPRISPVAYINPKYVRMVMQYVSDPRTPS